ncbi:MAG: TlpA family protein disulfide reductase, partial [Verrucomicrobiales bacterium]|nr:TlpA family protein disulfide reductase [Verrucomicrobiales bacterium]
YRGKYVVLIFWGDWCHGCHGVQPALINLANRFKDQPLQILGVNTDPASTARAAITSSQVPWRCWADGSTSGPITSEWNLHHFPTVYLIGPDGVILEKNPNISSIADSLIRAGLTPTQP